MTKVTFVTVLGISALYPHSSLLLLGAKENSLNSGHGQEAELIQPMNTGMMSHPVRKVHGSPLQHRTMILRCLFIWKGSPSS